MPTKFKDVAHLYLPFLAIVDDRSYMVHGFTQSEDMFQVDIDEQDTDWWNTENFTPVLKPLSTITPEQIKIAFPFSGSRFFPDLEFHDLEPMQFVELLKMGFDLFGLIESGEAKNVESLTSSPTGA